MMPRRPLAVILLLGPLCACASPQNYVVLLDSGQPSAVTVKNQGGGKVLDQPGQAVAIADQTSAPKSAVLAESEVKKIWAGALAYEPPSPVSFILYFVLDTTTLVPESRAQLPKVLELIKLRPAPEVAVTGYTDRSGATEYNYDLGLRRAEAVRREIEAIGVPGSLITVASYGAANPLIQTNRPYEPRNRRVEITVR
jgi:peptidoglycan-associated lipoprotein